jgi:hypothetical protein
MVAEFISTSIQFRYLQRICVAMKLPRLLVLETKMMKNELKLPGMRMFWWLLPPRRRIQSIQSSQSSILSTPISLSLKPRQPLRPEEAAAGLPAGESSLLGPQNEPGW